MAQARAALLIVLLGVAGCAQGPFAGLRPVAPETPADEGAPIATVAGLPADALPEGADPTPGTDAAAPPPSAVTVEQFDTTSAAERVAAAEVPTGAPEEPLGTTIASLGDPSLPGFWAETPLVSEVRQGRLTYGATGKSVQVELRPSGEAAGSGTRVSLPAMRVLEAPLTALPELSVIGL